MALAEIGVVDRCPLHVQGQSGVEQSRHHEAVNQ